MNKKMMPDLTKSLMDAPSEAAGSGFWLGFVSVLVLECSECGIDVKPLLPLDEEGPARVRLMRGISRLATAIADKEEHDERQRSAVRS